MLYSRRWWRTAFTLAFFTLVAGIMLAPGVIIGRDFWTREHPLVNPVAAIGVRDGVISLADGRNFRPAGIRMKTGTSAGEFDKVLMTMVAQGVVVERDLGDGRAVLICEPKFYNWCGTRGCGAKNRRDRWAGGYFQCPLGPLLVVSGYAEAVLDEPGLDEINKWRLEGASATLAYSDRRFSRSRGGDSFAYDAWVRELSDLDKTLALRWKDPPEAIGR